MNMKVFEATYEQGVLRELTEQQWLRTVAVDDISVKKL